MFKILLDWIIHSQTAKTAGAAAGGSMITITMLMGVLDKKVEAQMDLKHDQALTFVERKYDALDSKISLLQAEIVFVKTSQIEHTNTLRVISDRIYDMNKRSKD